MTHRQAIQGRIADRPVADLLQSLHEERKTGVARFRTALGSAMVWFRDGELVDADMGRFHMEAAVLRLLRIQDGEYAVDLEAISRRRVIKSDTGQLLAEARQRAPRVTSSVGTGRSPAQPISSEYSHIGGGVRDEAPSLPLAAETARTTPAPGHATPAVSPRDHSPSESSAETVLRSAPPDPESDDTDAHTVVGSRSLAVDEAIAASSPSPGSSTDPSPRSSTGSSTGSAGPRRRVASASWDPTAGGDGQASATPAARSPSRPPTTATKPPGKKSRRGRTRFMFGVAGPSSPQAAEPSAGTVDPSVGAVDPTARTIDPTAQMMNPPRAGDLSARPAAPSPRVVDPPARPVGPPTSQAGSIRTTPPGGTDIDAARKRKSTESRRRRAHSQPRAQVPFEPERIDKTIMRIGPIPPPPGQSGPTPVATRSSTTSGGSPIPAVAVGPSRGPASAAPGSASADRTLPAGHIYGGFPQPVVNEEYSHPISVPTAPHVGPGGTWMLNKVDEQRPLPDDPQAEETIVIRSSDIPGGFTPPEAGKFGATAHVGRYEVLLRLARGGMGTVYLCRVTGEGGFRRLFALKVIRDHLNTNRTYVNMLLEEARIASRLSHPNIVSIIDIDTFAGQHYLVMDYVEGCTFSELLKAHPKTRPPELVIPVILDALTGLHAAHSMRGDDGSMQPVVHCDFSPQNMLVGVNGTCRITDFGISKAADALPRGPGRGKPGYLSPEQVRGHSLDPRSDIFSAGVVMWNALTGEPLFDGETPDLIMHQVLTRAVPKPSSMGLRPPACFDAICLRALERDPARRYQSAEQMLTDLRKVSIAQDLLAPSSEVGRWVQETFGAQIEVRRQSAGLAPSAHSTGSSLHGLAGPSGHPDALSAEATALEENASQTMMIQPGVITDPFDEEPALGARTRVVILVAALAFAVAAVVTLFVRPDLLEGGIIDDYGQYVESGPSDLVVPPGDESTGAEPAAAASSTGAEPAGAEPSGTDSGDQTESGNATGAGDTGGAESTPPEPPVGSPTKGRKNRGRKNRGDDPKGGKDRPKKPRNKRKPKRGDRGDDGSTDEPPPDLEELLGPGNG